MNYIDINNFEDSLPVLAKQIQQCEFYAIDLEFSALNVGIADELTKYDSIEDQYQKTRYLCNNNHILQFGLSLYVWDGTTMTYNVQAYAFYLGTKGLQSFQSKSYKFLASTDYDFKRTFLHGIPFSRLHEQQVVQPCIQSDVVYQHDIYAELDRIKQIIINSKNHKTKIECHSKEAIDLLMKTTFQDKFFAGLTKFNIQKCNDNLILVIKPQQEHRQFGELEVPKEIEFQQLIAELIKSRKIMIGHNPAIDFCLLFHNFIEVLPDTYEEFQHKFHQIFPLILDTKLIANYFRETFNLQKKMQNNLEALFKECYLNDKCLKPFNNIKLNFDFIHIFKTQGLHDAGYDALVTGNCCICMSNMLTGKKQQLNLVNTFEMLINKYHNHGYEIQIGEIGQINLQDNNKFINNTIYGEYTNQGDYEQFTLNLQEVFTFERTLINNQFYFTICSPTIDIPELERICDKFTTNNLLLLPYKNRRHFKYGQ